MGSRHCAGAVIVFIRHEHREGVLRKMEFEFLLAGGRLSGE